MIKKKRARLPFRLNILFFIVFLMFSVLVLQLGSVQILNGKDYQEKIDSTILDTTKIPVPRGKIRDRNNKVIVDNKPLYSITYTPPKNAQADEKLMIAKKLAEYITMDTEKQLKALTERNKKEYWYLENKEKAESRLSKEELVTLDNTEQYNTVLDRITEAEIDSFTKQELEVISIKKELDKGYALTPQIVKNENLTPEEYARVAEHLDVLPGVNATTDWDRIYPYEDVFSSLLGGITSQEQGIPAEKEQYYLTRGYNRNDRVGKSGLEEQYEELLRGRKEQIQYTTNKNGKVIDSKVVVPGERGKDLILSIDMEYQQKVDAIVQEELRKEVGRNRHLADALVVVMNPKTGELLAVSGQHYNRKEGKFENAAYRTLYDAHRPGSSVKGATVLAGLQSGVTTPGQYFYDTPILIPGTPKKASWKNFGSIDAKNALKYSSNVYMFHIAMRMGGEFNYRAGKSISFKPEGFQQMRNYFQQFGLGVNTGIDYPYESTGYVGTEAKPGLLMDYAIGQYDTFTTMQLAQYVSTIANDGYRVRPHFLKEAREPSPYDNELGPVSKTMNTDVLNKIEMNQSQIDLVKEGFRRAFQDQNGTAASHFAKKSYRPAGKTGTAENEVYINGTRFDTENLTLVGYAPMNDPEIAFAVVVPNITKGVKSKINLTIGSGILDAYFDLKKAREQGVPKTEDTNIEESSNPDAEVIE